MQRRNEQRRLVALLGVSLVLHALLLWWFGRQEVAPAALSASQPMVLEELVWIDAAPPAAPPAPLSPPVKQKATKATPREAVVSAEPPAASGGDGQPSTVETSPRGAGPIINAPSLLPSAAFAISLGTGGLEEPSRGSAVRNGPGEAPDKASLNEYTGEVLTRKLNADLREDVGRMAMEVGNVPGHFKRYEAAMRGALPRENIDKTPVTAGDVARDVVGLMFNDGPSAEASKKVVNTPLGQSVMRQTVPTANVEDQRFRESALQMLAQTENVRERVTRPRLRTVLEMTTDASGALAAVSIVEKSGDPRFDESVLHFSRKVARSLPDNDEKMLGANFWRSRWQFTWEPPDVRVRLLNAWRVDESPGQ